MKNHTSRRVFLERLGTCTLGGATLSQLLNRRAKAQNAAAWVAPPKLTNPNILVIIVDQMRWPRWLASSGVTASQAMTILDQQILPNIFGRLRDHSYVFQQYYTAATVCTAARGTLLTGLYAPQTACYVGTLMTATVPALVPAFRTWAEAVQALNSAYKNNLWWFGKWHVSKCVTTAPLQPYGFNTRTYPGGSSRNPSPDGFANEGTDGGLFNGTDYTSDAQITGDFIGWLQGQAPTPAPPASPWCATVSLINPHDISWGPAWLQSSPFPPTNVGLQPVYFPPPPFPPLSGAPALFLSLPTPWNFEDLKTVTNKPSLQYAFQTATSKAYGVVTDWVLFLNQYYWLQNYVDQQVKLILDALASSPYAGNTIIIFTSDHGEFGGSHGLHDKGDAVYDEAIQVPLYVQFPGQTSNILMNQMGSSVDFFGLICDLATSDGGLWKQAYPDLAPRQSIWSFLYKNARETRIAPTLGIPYIFHTCDHTNGTPQDTKAHIVGLRTKANANNQVQPGAKLAIYSEWASCTTIPDNTPPEYEFYDYNTLTTNNRGERGNDYFSTNSTTQATIAEYLSELGSWGPLATGLIATELDAPLVGTGTDGNPLSQAQAAARQNYLNYSSGPGCTG